jgi:tetratricopeptide (TPR) repeat protein
VRRVHKRLSDFSALDCFYRGMWHLNKLSAEDYTLALQLFREATGRDRELSLGHIGLARILHGGVVHGWSPRPLEDLREARAAAQTAIGLDALDAWAYFAASGASLYLGDHDVALAEARRSINLNRNFSLGQVRLGQVLIFSGQPEEAIVSIEHGVRLSPYDPQLWVMLESLALAYYHTGDYERAISYADAAMHESFSKVSILLAASLAQAGRLRDAAQVLPPRVSREAGDRQLIAPRYKDPARAERLRQGVRLARSGI